MEKVDLGEAGRLLNEVDSTRMYDIQVPASTPTASAPRPATARPLTHVHRGARGARVARRRARAGRGIGPEDASSDTWRIAVITREGKRRVFPVVAVGQVALASSRRRVTALA